MQETFNLFVCSVVRVENHTRYNLEYVASGTKSGAESAPMVNVFGRSVKINGASYHVLPPGWSGRNCWQVRPVALLPKTTGEVLSLGLFDTNVVCGWFSVRLRCPGKDHIVCCGFRTSNPSFRNNGAGIQIRGEDGVLDGKGSIPGHGTTPTGAVSDPHALATMHLHHGVGGWFWQRTYDTIQEEARAVRVHCEFNNLPKANHIFKFYNGVEQVANANA